MFQIIIMLNLLTTTVRPHPNGRLFTGKYLIGLICAILIGVDNAHLQAIIII